MGYAQAQSASDKANVARVQAANAYIANFMRNYEYADKEHKHRLKATLEKEVT